MAGQSKEPWQDLGHVQNTLIRHAYPTKLAYVLIFHWPRGNLRMEFELHQGKLGNGFEVSQSALPIRTFKSGSRLLLERFQVF